MSFPVIIFIDSTASTDTFIEVETLLSQLPLIASKYQRLNEDPHNRETFSGLDLDTLEKLSRILKPECVRLGTPPSTVRTRILAKGV